MGQSELRELQEIELEILIEVDRVCRKHNIKYFLVAGTLLGAIRHRGFIPWDDDIDICMPIKDYKKFCRIARSEMKSDLFVYNYETDKTGIWFSKIRKDGTTMMEAGNEHKKIHHGIWIDVFPLISIKSDEEWQRKITKKARFFKQSLNTCFNSRGDLKNLPFRYRLIRLIPLWLVRGIARIGYSSIFRYNKKWDYCYYLWGDPKIFGRFESNLFDDLCEVEFEGHMFFAPKRWDEYLTLLYNDYMTPPPPESRRGGDHKVSIIDTKNGPEKYIKN